MKLMLSRLYTQKADYMNKFSDRTPTDIMNDKSYAAAKALYDKYNVDGKMIWSPNDIVGSQYELPIQKNSSTVVTPEMIAEANKNKPTTPAQKQTTKPTPSAQATTAPALT
jgi:hypothetical protein